jgi:hypothetical protein
MNLVLTAHFFGHETNMLLRDGGIDGIINEDLKIFL